VVSGDAGKLENKGRASEVATETPGGCDTWGTTVGDTARIEPIPGSRNARPSCVTRSAFSLVRIGTVNIKARSRYMSTIRPCLFFNV